MKVQTIKSNNVAFDGKIPPLKKNAIKAFAIEHLKEQTGYASSKSSFFNAIAIIMREVGGLLATGLAVEEFPKAIHGDKFAFSLLAATGLGSLAVAASRLEADKIATGSAKVRVKPFVKKMIEKGYKSEDELLFGIKSFMSKSGGFFTSVIPNKFSSKRAIQILKESRNTK